MAKRTKANKRRRNPLYKSTGIPRPKIGFNGQLLSTTAYASQSATDATKQGADYFTLDASAGESVARAGFDVLKHYEDFKFRSAFLEFQPSVGPAGTDAGSKVYIAYIDNPELIVTFKAAATRAAQLSIVRNVRNVKSFNAWERYTYRVPVSFRRRWFSTNPTVGSPSPEETDRSIQGMVVVAYESITASLGVGALGLWRIGSVMELRNFNASVLT